MTVEPSLTRCACASVLLVNISGKVTSKNPNSEFAAKPNRGEGTMKRNEGEKKGSRAKTSSAKYSF